ncbi:MAG: ABC transporter ATP-binding protein [Spirochaetaceae bacterium]|nr:ABC transporter ATP-binding protein [Spirochaetaceae bacterium]
MLDVQNLSVGLRRGKGYLTVIDGISFHIPPGKILGLVGESGCGKTLTARAIPGLLPPGLAITGGDLLFNGTNMRNLSPRALRRIRGQELAMIFQEPLGSLNPLMKIGRQIGEALELHGETDKKLRYARTLETMEKVGLPDPRTLAERYPHQLSGGMRQRAMIAAAVICGPKLLIADEPTTALDVTIQAQILALLEAINGELGTAILFISHDLDVIRQICGKVLVMYAGKIVEAGNAEAVFSQPQHEYTKGLIGSIPVKNRKGLALTAIPGKAPSIEEKTPGCPFAPRCRIAKPVCFRHFPQETRINEDHYVHCHSLRN